MHIAVHVFTIFCGRLIIRKLPRKQRNHGKVASQPRLGTFDPLPYLWSLPLVPHLPDLWSLGGCSSDCAPVLGLGRLPLLVLPVRGDAAAVRDRRRRRRRHRRRRRPHLHCAVVPPLAVDTEEARPEAHGERGPGRASVCLGMNIGFRYLCRVIRPGTSLIKRRYQRIAELYRATT